MTTHIKSYLAGALQSPSQRDSAWRHRGPISFWTIWKDGNKAQSADSATLCFGKVVDMNVDGVNYKNVFNNLSRRYRNGVGTRIDIEKAAFAVL